MLASYPTSTVTSCRDNFEIFAAAWQIDNGFLCLEYLVIDDTAEISKSLRPRELVVINYYRNMHIIDNVCSCVPRRFIHKIYEPNIFQK